MLQAAGAVAGLGGRAGSEAVVSIVAASSGWYDTAMWAVHLSWILAVLLLSDFAMPLSPGAFQFEADQSIEVLWPVSVQAPPAGQLPAPSHRFPAWVQRAAHPTIVQVDALRREATSPRAFVPFRSSYDESEALASEDPPLPALV